VSKYKPTSFDDVAAIGRTLRKQRRLAEVATTASKTQTYQTTAKTDEAQSTADKASTTASTAQSTADSAVDTANTAVATAKDAATITITSTHGLVFKDSAISTALMVIVFQPGGTRIEDQTALTDAFGSSAHIEWRWRRDDEDEWKTILTSDDRLTDDGFTLTVSPDDVNDRTSFEASVVVD
jgi:hypothetical protein